MTKVNILIPVFNERATILELIKRVEAATLPEGLDKELIIIDDGSSDGTTELLSKINHHIVIVHPINRGKGAAIKSGLARATGEIILIQDADLEYNPDEYHQLLLPILNGETKVVYGSRFLTKHQPRYKSLYFGNKLLSLVSSILFFQWISDMETCYKVFHREALNGLIIKSNRFNLEPEITAKFLRAGHKIKEVPISYQSRSFEQGKKIKWHDGLIAIWSLFKYRFFD